MKAHKVVDCKAFIIEIQNRKYNLTKGIFKYMYNQKIGVCQEV